MLKYRNERQKDGSVKTTTSSYPNNLRVCSTCEWCKTSETFDNDEIHCILTCHLQKSPRVCGVYKWVWPEPSQSQRRTEEFVPMIPQAEPSENPCCGLENKCGDYMPFGWHYEVEEKEYLRALDRRDPADPFGHLNRSFNKWIME